MSVDPSAIDRATGSAPVAMRPTLTGLRHSISAGHYIAAHAGFQILEAGGNAVDAGVAAGITLGVVQSDFVSFAGVAPILFRQADTGQVWSISGLGGWPRAATLDLFLREHGGSIPPGVLRTVVPAAPDAWITALSRFGTMSFAEVSAAAIRFAEDGFVMYPLMAEMIEMNIAGYTRWPSNSKIYLPGGSVPCVGDIFRQRDLAGVLKYMADQEQTQARFSRETGLRAARDAFYRGDIASVIVDYHKKHCGLLDRHDLESFSVEIERAVQQSFHGIDVYSCGFWCQGPTLIQMLNILERCDLRALGHNSARYAHLLIETIKLVFADREVSYGDPRFVDVPADRLLSKDYAAERLRAIRDDAAHPGMPPPGIGNAGPLREAGSPGSGEPPIDTSYVCVVDGLGNVFSATPSDSSNSTPVIPGTGLCISSRGSQSWAEAGHASAIAPEKRPRLTPNPSMAVRPGEFVMPFGSPGGDVQTQAMLQAFLNVTVFGMELQEAVEAPRFVSYSFPGSFEPHPIHPGRLLLEGQIDRSVGEALHALGHKIEWWDDRNWRAGGVCAIRRDEKTGILTAAADPRRPSYALGW